MGKLFLYRFYALIVFAVLFSHHTSLAGESYVDCETVTIDRFRLIELDSLQPEVLPYEMPVPYMMRVINDSVLIFTNEYSSPAVRVLNVNSGTCTGYINYGFNEYDILSVRSLHVDNGHISVYDCRQSKSFLFSWNDKSSELEFESLSTFTNNPARVVPDNRGNWIAVNSFSFSDSLYQVIGQHPTGHNIKFGRSPDIFIPDSLLQFDTNMFQGEIEWSSRHQRFVATLFDWDIVSIYGADFKLVRRLRGPFMTEHTYVLWPVNSPFQQQIIIDGETSMGYSRLINNSASGFSLAHNREEKYKSGKHEWKTISDIVSFDWDGNPLTVIHSSKPIANFAYDIDSGILYIVEMASEPDTPVKLKRYRIDIEQKL